MYCLEIALSVIGSALLIAGYRRNHRNLLLAAAILLFLSSAGAQFAKGFVDGAQSAVTDGAPR